MFVAFISCFGILDTWLHRDTWCKYLDNSGYLDSLLYENIWRRHLCSSGDLVSFLWENIWRRHLGNYCFINWLIFIKHISAVVTLWICISEVPGSNFSPVTNYPNIYRRTQSFQMNDACGVPQNISQLLPFICC